MFDCSQQTTDNNWIGNFNSKERAWLALWEAGIVVELPIGVLFYYPSALFLHFNIDIEGKYEFIIYHSTSYSSDPLELDRFLFTTDNDKPPTPETARPLHGVKGRGSIVLFNQASIFQLAELGYTIHEGEENGRATDSNNDSYVSQMPVFDV